MNDLDFVTKRIERLERETRVSNKDRGDKEKEMDLLRRLQPVLEGEKFLRGMDFAEQDAAMMVNYNLITVKPACYVINFSDDMSKEEVEKVRLGGENFLRDAGEDSPLLCVNAALEEELSSMGPDEISQFMGEYGIEEMGRDRVIKSAFSMLNLLTFFTVGEDECRSWHIHKGETALDAAGAIHSDLARGFIRAEVIGGETLLDLGSMNEAKKAGKLRLEGKTYVVNDGDIVHVMFNI